MKNKELIINNVKIEELNLPVKIYNKLKKQKINTLHQIIMLSFDELITILGKNATKELCFQFKKIFLGEEDEN